MTKQNRVVVLDVPRLLHTRVGFSFSSSAFDSGSNSMRGEAVRAERRVRQSLRQVKKVINADGAIQVVIEKVEEGGDQTADA